MDDLIQKLERVTLEKDHLQGKIRVKADAYASANNVKEKNSLASQKSRLKAKLTTIKKKIEKIQADLQFMKERIVLVGQLQQAKQEAFYYQQENIILKGKLEQVNSGQQQPCQEGQHGGQLIPNYQPNYQGPCGQVPSGQVPSGIIAANGYHQYVPFMAGPQFDLNNQATHNHWPTYITSPTGDIQLSVAGHHPMAAGYVQYPIGHTQIQQYPVQQPAYIDTPIDIRVPQNLDQNLDTPDIGQQVNLSDRNKDPPNSDPQPFSTNVFGQEMSCDLSQTGDTMFQNFS